MPRMGRDSMRDKGSVTSRPIYFHSLTILACLDISGNFGVHTRPPEIPLYRFRRSFRTGVSSNLGVMMLSDYLCTKCRTGRDVDQSISEDQTISGGEPFRGFAF